MTAPRQWTPRPGVHHPRPDVTYACAQPENPSSSLAHDWKCRACWLHAKVMVLTGRDHARVTLEHGTGREIPGLLSESVAKYAHRHEVAS